MDVKLPNLGEGADSGTVVNLLVKAGDTVTAGQGLLELESEKAVATIPAPEAGVVSKVFIKVGDKVSVGQRLLAIGGNAGAAPAPAPAAAPVAKAPVVTRRCRGPCRGPSARAARRGADRFALHPPHGARAGH